MVLPVEVSERGTIVLGTTEEAGKSSPRGLEACDLSQEDVTNKGKSLARFANNKHSEEKRVYRRN